MSARDEVLAVFFRFRDALMACDTGALDDLVSQGYRGYNLRGQPEDRNDILETYRPGAAVLDTWEFDDLEVEVFPDVAVLTGKGLVAGTWMGERWSHYLRFCDLYVRREGAWLLHLSQATPMEDQEDGSSAADPKNRDSKAPTSP